MYLHQWYLKKAKIKSIVKTSASIYFAYKVLFSRFCERKFTILNL